jgi:hypothetical protein
VRGLRAFNTQLKFLFLGPPLEVVLRQDHVLPSLGIDAFPLLSHDESVNIEDPLARNRGGLEAGVGPEEGGKKRKLHHVRPPELHYVALLTKWNLLGVPEQ